VDINLVKERCFVCCPFDMLVERFLPAIIEQGINVEIGLNGSVLDRYRLSTFRRIAKKFKKNSIKTTVHAPFTDLSLGAIDKKIRKVSLERLKKALEIAALFESSSVVCHTGFDLRHYWGAEERWIDNACDSLDKLIQDAVEYNIPIMLENVFELTPEIHTTIFSRIPHPLLGFCYDIGHHKVFSRTTQEQWLESMASKLGQLHLHDNMGRHDDHLPIGKGNLDFDGLFSWLKKNGKEVILTLEPHDEEAVMPSLDALGRLLEKYNM